MSSPIGRSPANPPRLQVFGPSGPARAPAAPTQARPPAPAAPSADPAHTSDFSQTDRLRDSIRDQTRSSPSLYGFLVRQVNSSLQAMGSGISPASHQSVMENLRQVSDGSMPQSTAHFREAQTFFQDARQSFNQGRYGQGLVESVGVVLNSVGGVGMRTLEDLGRHPPQMP